MIKVTFKYSSFNSYVVTIVNEENHTTQEYSVDENTTNIDTEYKDIISAYLPYALNHLWPVFGDKFGNIVARIGIEIFHSSDYLADGTNPDTGEPYDTGYYYWFAQPGALPDSEPIGPFNDLWELYEDIGHTCQDMFVNDRE